MDELKPCPFCGADEDWLQEIRLNVRVVDPLTGLICQRCGGAMLKNGMKTSLGDLYDAWNRRDGEEE